MAVSISLAVLLFIVVALLIWHGNLRTGSAIVCALFGFALSSTGVAPLINGGITALNSIISST